jgi:hypothetical protein
MATQFPVEVTAAISKGTGCFYLYTKIQELVITFGTIQRTEIPNIFETPSVEEFLLILL